MSCVRDAVALEGVAARRIEYAAPAARRGHRVAGSCEGGAGSVATPVFRHRARDRGTDVERRRTQPWRALDLQTARKAAVNSAQQSNTLNVGHRRTGPSHLRTGRSHLRTGPSHPRPLVPSHRYLRLLDRDDLYLPFASKDRGADIVLMTLETDIDSGIAYGQVGQSQPV